MEMEDCDQSWKDFPLGRCHRNLHSHSYSHSLSPTTIHCVQYTPRSLTLKLGFACSCAPKRAWHYCYCCGNSYGSFLFVAVQLSRVVEQGQGRPDINARIGFCWKGIPFCVLPVDHG